MFAANAPSHDFGGQKVAVNDGAIIFSDRINVPGENITFAKKAAMIGNDKKKLDELFRVQENYKTNK
jgi:hypothetical protein